MKGNSKFTSKDALAIKEHLRELREVEREAQKQIRAHLRSKYKFYISNYTNTNKGFTEADFDEIVRQGMIKIKV